MMKSSTFEKMKTRCFAKKAVIATAMAGLLLASSGCSLMPANSLDKSGNTNPSTSTDASTERKGTDTVFTFAGEKVSLGEMYIYASAVRDHYEENYGQGIWSLDVSAAQDKSRSLEDEIRESVVQDVIRVKMLNAHAEDYDIMLTEDQAEMVASETDAFYFNLTDQQIEDMQLDRELAHAVFTENEIASLVYDKIIEESGIEVSDEEAQMTTFYDLYFPFYQVASNGDVSEISDEEKEEEHERAVEAYDQLTNPNKGQGATGAETLIQALADSYSLKDSGFQTMSPGEIVDVYGADIAEDISKLEDGSYSLVTESEYGYHIFYLKAKTDRAATDARKAEILKNRRNVYLEGIFTKWQSDMDSTFLYENDVDQDVYQKIKF